MSLLNLIVQPDCAYLMTDSATYAPDGAVMTLGSKAVVAPRQCLAIGTSGMLNCYQLIPVMRALEHLPQDKFLLELPHMARAAMEIYDVDKGSPTIVAVAGFSEERGGPFGLVFSTGDSSEEPKLVPWQLTPRKTMLLPYPAAIQKAFRGLATFNPLTDSLPLIEQQRRENFGTDDEPQYCVAGDINVVAVSREGLKVHTIHSCPATLGEKVVLEPALN